MDLRELSRLLGGQVQTQGQQRLLAEITAHLEDLSIPPAQRDAHAYGVVAREAERMLSQSWTLPPAVLAELRELTGWSQAREVLRGMLAAHVGLSQVSLEPKGQLWVPFWLALEAADRCGQEVTHDAERWAIPPRWPVPVHQVLVRGLPRATELISDLLVVQPFTPAVVVPGPAFPDAWSEPLAGDLPLREDLMLLMQIDPHRGMQALLTEGSHPLIGCAVQVAVLLLQAHAALRAQGSRWRGELPCGLGVARCGESVLIETGWLGLCLRSLGLDCTGCPLTASQDVEEALIERWGGRILANGEQRIQLLTADAGRLLRQLELPWEAVAEVTITCA